MFEVLAFLYDNYWHVGDPSEVTRLGPQLSALGFESQDIEDAMLWLDGLDHASCDLLPPDQFNPVPHWHGTPGTDQTSTRVFTRAEQAHLGLPCLGYLSEARHSGLLPGALLELVVDRAMATPESPVSLDQLQLMVLLINWRFGMAAHLWPTEKSDPNDMPYWLH